MVGIFQPVMFVLDVYMVPETCSHYRNCGKLPQKGNQGPTLVVSFRVITTVPGFGGSNVFIPKHTLPESEVVPETLGLE